MAGKKVTFAQADTVVTIEDSIEDSMTCEIEGKLEALKNFTDTTNLYSLTNMAHILRMISDIIETIDKHKDHTSESGYLQKKEAMQALEKFFRDEYARIKAIPDQTTRPSP